MNNNLIPVVLNWSSGKDAALAYKLLQQDRYNATQLLTAVNDEHDRVVMHGVREDLLDAQAERMGLPLIKVKLPAAPTDDAYRQAMQSTLTELKEAGIHTAAFGDIFLEDLKIYREQQLAQVGFDAVFPLWEKDTRALVAMVEDAGIEAVIVCVNEKFLGKDFLGRKIGRDLLRDLPENVDPCGENGEFHTFVYNAPFFSSAIPVAEGEVVYKGYMPAEDDKDKWNMGFYFLDLLPAT